MTFEKIWISLLSWGLFFLPQAVHGVFIGPPGASAGVVEREVQEQYGEAGKVEPEKPVPMLEVDIPSEQLALGEGETVYISTIRIQGNTVISSCILQNAVRCFEGQELSMKQIRAVCCALQKEYVCQGYFLARAYPPEQEIEKGTLIIEIIEGKLGKITVVGNKYYKDGFIRSYFTPLQNRAVNYDQFLKTLLLINDNSDLSVGAVFKKGSEYGTADVILQVVDKRPVHLYLNTNNYGSKLTTQQRTGARLDYGNLFFGGDTFSVAEVVGSPLSDLTFTDVRYRVPLSRQGTHLMLTYLHSEFEVGVLKPLDLGGRSDIVAGKITQALRRTRRCNTDMYLHFDYKQIKNFAFGTTNSFDKLRNAGGGWTFDYVDPLKGRNLGDLHLVAGIPNILGGSGKVDSLSSRKGGGGKYWIYYLDYTRFQQLPRDIYLILQLSGQYSNWKLPLAEQIYVGGMEATRGYPVAAALGDKGYHGSVELRYAIPYLKDKKAPFTKKTWKEVLQLLFFYDRGQVWLNGGNTANQKGAITLNGVGAGFRIYGPWKFEWSFDVGFPLTSEKKTSDTVLYFKVSWQPF